MRRASRHCGTTAAPSSIDRAVGAPVTLPRGATLGVLTVLGLRALMPIVLLATCTPSVDLSPANWPADELEQYWELTATGDRPHPLAEGEAGVVTGTSGALAVRAGLEALKQGGSAVDAVLTTSLAQIALAAGSWVSYAGFMTMVYYEAETGQVHAMNAGFNTVRDEHDPLSIPSMGEASGRSVFVSGFMAGVQAAHDRFGRLPFASLFAPAIFVAEEGFALGPRVAGVIANWERVLRRLPETATQYTKDDGSLLSVGDHFAQPQLAMTLRRIASEGAAYMYEGEWASKFVEAVRKEGGKMTLKDLAAYRVRWDSPVRTSYHDFEVFAPGPPNSGGTAILEALNILERAQLKQLWHYSQSPEALYWLVQIARVAEVTDPRIEQARPLALLKQRVGLEEFSPEIRLEKQTARLLWDAMQEPVWRTIRDEAHQVALVREEIMQGLIRTSRGAASHRDILTRW